MKPNAAEDPKLTPAQWGALQTLFHRILQLAAQNAGMNKTCLSCLHFDEEKELCTFYNPAMRPPARIIVEACLAHTETPF